MRSSVRRVNMTYAQLLSTCETLFDLQRSFELAKLLSMCGYFPSQDLFNLRRSFRHETYLLILSAHRGDERGASLLPARRLVANCAPSMWFATRGAMRRSYTSHQLAGSGFDLNHKFHQIEAPFDSNHKFHQFEAPFDLNQKFHQLVKP